jgi:alpha-glucosidase
MADDELYLDQGRPVAEDDWEIWYEATLSVHNPITRYRFLLLRSDGRAFDWLNAAGLQDFETSDSADFKMTVFGGAPHWSVERPIYQVFPDRFARSASADARPAPAWAVRRPWGQTPIPGGDASTSEFFGGDLFGLAEHLDHIEALGAGAVYLTPFFPAGSVHRYNAVSFDLVDPALGGNEALAALSRAVHARGLRLIGDLTTNHTGSDHEWFQRAVADPDSPEAAFYIWLRHPDDYVGWWDSPTLPKLNWASQELRRRYTTGPDSVVARWLKPPYDLDGWRIDVANMTGRHRGQDLAHSVARDIRATVEAVKPSAALVAEHMHDASRDLQGDGWQAGMNYAGFTRPLWTWLADPANDTNYFGLPLSVPRRGGRPTARAMREYAALLPWRVAAAMWNNLGSHDTIRFLSLVSDRAVMRAGAAFLMTYLGVPMIFAGDEWGATGVNGEHGRVTMPWDEPDRQDGEMFAAYQSLTALRGAHPALVDGGLRWVLAEDDALAYLRESADEILLVLVARTDWPGAVLDPSLLRGRRPTLLHGPADLIRSEAGYAFPSCGPAAFIWQLS